jgi:hypothetical protein
VNTVLHKLDIAVRAYPVPDKSEPRSREKRTWNRPSAMLVFDTETRTDETQRLTFGSFRFFENGICKREGIFYAESLSEADRAVLQKYAASRPSDAKDRKPVLELMTRAEFLKEFFDYAYRGHCLVVGFNLPFDFARVARGFSSARGRFAGGFSLDLFFYIDDSGMRLPVRS